MRSSIELLNMHGAKRRLLMLMLPVLGWSWNPALAQTCSQDVRRPRTPSEALDYLFRFGYLSAQELWRGSGSYALRQALETFQEMAHITQTGVLDFPTYRMMQIERCGNLDVSSSQDDDSQSLPSITQRRKKRFARQETQWHKQHLTYRIMNYTPDLSREQVDRTIAAAFKVWSDVTPLTFTPSTCSPVDIEIRFASGDHGDGSPFDGQWGSLGHAFYPYANEPGIDGDAHFDEAENWILDYSDDGANLLFTAAHEFGHSLGLRHSMVKGSLMWPLVGDQSTKVSRASLLTQDDIDGIQSIYGSPDKFDPKEPLPITNCTSSPRQKSTTTTTLSSSPKTPSTAASTSTSKKTTSTTKRSRSTTRPTTSTSSASASTFMPTPSSTAASTPTSSTTSTTKTTLSTTSKTSPVTTGTTPEPMPEGMQPWTTTDPCSGSVDAITKAVDGQIYAFRGTMIFCLNTYGVETGFPKPISTVFPRGPSFVDAALTVKLKGKHSSERTYLISGSYVWRYRAERLSPYTSELQMDWDFPRSLSEELRVYSKKINAAFVTGGRYLDTAYLVDDDYFWEVKFDKNGRTKARRNRIWWSQILDSLPRIDAAFYDDAVAKTYFFSGQNYYRQSSYRTGTLLGPRDTGTWWFGCQGNQQISSNW